MQIKRRFVAATVGMMVSAVAFGAVGDTPPIHVDHAGLKSLTWQLECQASTFPKMTTLDMLDLLHTLDFHHFELSPGQVISADQPEVVAGPDMPDASIAALQSKVKSLRMSAESFGVVSIGKDEELARKIFAFGKKMKMKTIVVDDSPDVSIEMLDKVATEFGVNAALYIYCAPGSKASIDVDQILKSVEGRSPRVAICLDVASWERSALKPPMSVAEGIKKFGSRLVEVHFSDVGQDGNETPLGTGKVDLAAVVGQMKDQGFKGICVLKYDSGEGKDRLEHFAASVNAFSDALTKAVGGK